MYFKNHIFIFALLFICYNNSHAGIIQKLFSNSHQKQKISKNNTTATKTVNKIPSLAELKNELVPYVDVDTNHEQPLKKIGVSNNLSDLLDMIKSKSNSSALLPFFGIINIITRNLKLGFYFFLWYFFTVVYNISNKQVLNELPLPATGVLLNIAVALTAIFFMLLCFCF